MISTPQCLSVISVSPWFNYPLLSDGKVNKIKIRFFIVILLLNTKTANLVLFAERISNTE